MISKNNQWQKLQKQAKQVPHYGIRKLTVGVSSILLGLSFMGLSMTSVKADTVTPSATDSSEETSNENQLNASEVTLSKNTTNSNQQINNNSSSQTKSDEQTSTTATSSNQFTDNKNNQVVNNGSDITENGPIDVANAADFLQNIQNAKADNSETNLRLIGDINLGNQVVVIKKGQNIHITNDGQRRTIYLGNQWFVQAGGNLVLDGTYNGQCGIALTRPTGKNPEGVPSGVQITVPDESGWVTYFTTKNPEAPIAIYGHANFNNVDIHDFVSAGGGHIFPFVPGGTVLAIGGAAELNLQGHTQVRNNKFSATFNSILSAMNYSAGVNYFTYPRGHSATGTIGKDVVFDGNMILPEVEAKVDNGTGLNPQTPMGAGALFVSFGSHVDINGTTFTNNVGGYYGAILVGGLRNPLLPYQNGDQAVIKIHGAHINHNTAEFNGGGLTIIGNVDATIDQGTEINDNKAGYYGNKLTDNPAVKDTKIFGGGLIVAEDNNKGTLNELHAVLDDVTINGNRCRGIGGGMYVNTNGLELKQATISNNVANVYGGGIYLGQIPYSLHIANAAVYDNRAVDDSNSFTFALYDNQKKSYVGEYRIPINSMTKKGQGVFAVTIYNAVTGQSVQGVLKLTSDNLLAGKIISVTDPDHPTAEISSNDHIIIRNTFVGGTGGGVWACPTGDTNIDITDGWAVFDNTAQNGGADFYHEEKGENVQVNVHSRSLGGADANWTHDRDQADGQRLTSDEIGDDTGLQSHLSADAKEIAKALASVKIYGNIADFGGGIAGNGGIYTGFSRVDNRSKDIVVKKTWQGDDKGYRPKEVSVTVYLNINHKNYQVTSFVLSAANNWTATLKDLPTNIDYTFVEQPIDVNGDKIPDYKITYGKQVKQASADPNVDVYDLNITNQFNLSKITEKIPDSKDQVVTPGGNWGDNGNQQTTTNTTGQATANLTKNRPISNKQQANRLPQTGNQSETGAVALGLATMLSVLGLAGLKRKHQ